MQELNLVGTNSTDYDEYYRIRCSPGDVFWNGYLTEPDYKNFKKIFENRVVTAPFNKPEDRHIYLIQLCDTVTKFNIGFIQLIRRVNSVEVGYTIIEAYQKKGYATKALLKAVSIALQYENQVIVSIRDDNIASQKVASKCGFERTDEYVEKDYPKCGTVKLRTYRYNGANNTNTLNA